MAKQTFTTGQVLTAAQMTSLQQTAMLGGTASAKTASYTLVAADAGTTISMSNAGSTTITVNTGLFSAGDIVTILNVGAGTCTVTAGTATVSKPTNATLALVQNAGGVLYFTATGAATFLPFDVGSAGTNANYSSLGTGTLTGATTITVSGISNINKLHVVVRGASSVNTGALFSVRLNGDTGSNYIAAGPTIDVPTAYAAVSFGSTNSAATSFPLSYMSSNAASVVNGGFFIDGCNTAGTKIIIATAGGNAASGQDQTHRTTFGYYTGSSTISSVSLISSSGNFDAGTYEVYGSL